MKGFKAKDPNLYRYTGNQPIRYRDAWGLDYQVCSRPLKGLPTLGYPLEHAYILYSDGSTTSWGPSESMFGSAGINNTNDSGGTCGAMKSSTQEQEQNMKNWARNHEGIDYDVLLYNCRDFVNDTINAGP